MSLQRITDKISLIDAPFIGETGVLGTYLIEGERRAVIDPGPTSQAIGVIDILNRNKINDLDAVLLTHIHLDHAGGSWKMVDVYKGSYVHCHPKGVPHMIDPSRLKAGAEKLFGDHVLDYGEITGVPAGRMRESYGGEVIDLGGITLEVLWTPGHSSHSQTYWEPDSKTVFVGDAGGRVIGDSEPVVPTSPPPHNPVRAVESIDRIIALNSEKLCIAHFGFFDDPAQHLNRIKKRSILWEGLSLQAAREDMSLDELVELVQGEDEEFFELTKGMGSPELTLKNSLIGFWMYGKWKLG
jgi:glyoxylase-like metal-dependent hydrolase (beta-lactamase superfamily II)